MLPWYAQNKRVLPWRQESPHKIPYHVMLSELMLQQTTVQTVKGYFERFIEKYPTLKDLANAKEEDILTQWQGLGYYSRARSLHKAAKAIIQNHKGQVPNDLKTLKSLAGLGDYTSNAIMAIAFNKKAMPVDANIARVYARLYQLEGHGDALKKRVKERLEHTVPEESVGDYIQALMDLGASFCKAKTATCHQCPVQSVCDATQEGTWHHYPWQVAKKERPVMHTIAYILQTPNGDVYLRKRPAKGILASMYEVPSTPWQEEKKDNPIDTTQIPYVHWIQHPWEKVDNDVVHIFTHLKLIIQRYKTTIASAKSESAEGIFIAKEKLKDYPLPTLTKKILRT